MYILQRSSIPIALNVSFFLFWVLEFNEEVFRILDFELFLLIDGISALWDVPSPRSSLPKHVATSRLVRVDAHCDFRSTHDKALLDTLGACTERVATSRLTPSHGLC